MREGKEGEALILVGLDGGLEPELGLTISSNSFTRLLTLFSVNGKLLVIVAHANGKKGKILGILVAPCTSHKAGRREGPLVLPTVHPIPMALRSFDRSSTSLYPLRLSL